MIGSQQHIKTKFLVRKVLCKFVNMHVQSTITRTNSCESLVFHVFPNAPFGSQMTLIEWPNKIDFIS